MDEFLSELLPLLEKHKDKRGMKAFMVALQTPIMHAREDKTKFIAELKEMIRTADNSILPPTDKEKKVLKEFIFVPDDFEGKKMTPQPAPPADSEIKGAETKPQPKYKEAEVEALFAKGLNVITEEDNLEGFIAQCKELGCTFKTNPKTIEAAWKAWEKFAREVLGI